MSAALIWGASAIWSSASAIARLGVGAGLLKQAKLDSRVVSVGNIQVGGAGKTPLVALIAQEAAHRGLKVCILCRGYGSAWETQGGILKPGGPRPDAAICGDEAALLHDLAPQAYIGVGAKRDVQYEKVRHHCGGAVDLVILDDGFQHWKIHKDMEIVAITSLNRGQVFFRDWASALKRADLVVWTKGDQEPHTFGKPCVKIRYKLSQPQDSRPLWYVTGLADGAHACELARHSGYRVEKHLSFPDHARYAEETVRGVLKSAAEAGCRVAVTGKDWVKWRGFGISSADVLVLEPKLIFEKGKELWDQKLWGQSRS